MPPRQSQLTRDDIVAALERLDSYLAKEGVCGEISLYGGSCLCLAFAARTSTRDVDAVFEPAAVVRKAAFEIASELGWDWNWLNDDVKGFLSRVRSDGTEIIGSLELPNLKVYGARADYLLAMKCLAARGASDTPDLDDAVFLCRKLDISTREEIVEIVLRYFPDRTPPERTDFFIEEIITLLNQGT